MVKIMEATDRLFKLIDKCSNIDEVKNQFPDLDFLTYFYSIIGFYRSPTSCIVECVYMDKNEYFDIIDGKVSPNRNQVLQLANAVRLDIKKTNFLLSLANHSILDPKNTRDSLIIFSIKNHYYLEQVNYILSNCHLKNIK